MVVVAQMLRVWAYGYYPDADIRNIEIVAINMKCETTGYMDLYNRNHN